MLSMRAAMKTMERALQLASGKSLILGRTCFPAFERASDYAQLRCASFLGIHCPVAGEHLLIQIAQLAETSSRSFGSVEKPVLSIAWPAETDRLPFAGGRRMILCIVFLDECRRSVSGSVTYLNVLVRCEAWNAKVEDGNCVLS